jgi:hypothetical protein
MMRFLWRAKADGVLAGFLLGLLLVGLLGAGCLALRWPAGREPARPYPTVRGLPVRVPIRELETPAWEYRWVVVCGVVAPDGTDGRDWVGISGDGKETRVVLLFRTQDFRRCRAGEAITVEGFHRGSRDGVVELVECRFRSGLEVLGIPAPPPMRRTLGR